jgi:hypothetical protein
VLINLQEAEMSFHAGRYCFFPPAVVCASDVRKISAYSQLANLAAMKGALPCATTLSCDLEVLQEIRELQVILLTVQV